MIKSKTTFDSAVLLLGAYLGENTQRWHRNSRASVFPVLWFIV